MKSQEKNAIWQRYFNSEFYSLRDCYTRFSKFKDLAFKQCEKIRDNMDGFDLRIINRGCSYFTAGFQYFSPETGALSFCYIYPDRSRGYMYSCVHPIKVESWDL